MTHEELEAFLKKANEANNSGNYDEAERLVSEVMFSVVAPYSTPAQNGGLPGLSNHSSSLRFVEGEDGVRVYSKALFSLAWTNKQRGNFELSLEQLHQGLALVEAHDLSDLKPKAWNIIGAVYADIGSYDAALEYYEKGLVAHEVLGEELAAVRVIGNIGIVHYSLGNYDKALEYFSKALDAHQYLGEKSGVAAFIANIGSVHVVLRNYDKALEYLSKALEVHQNLGEKSGVATVTGNIGSVHADLGNYEKAIEYLGKALQEHELLGEKLNVSHLTGSIGLLYTTHAFEGYDAAKAEELLFKAIMMNEELGTKKELSLNHQALSVLYKHEKRWVEYSEHYERYHELYIEVQSEEATKQAQQMENRRKVEESERDRQVKLARFQEQEKILHNILPSLIAERIVSGEKTIADSHESVSVFFSDIVGFTKLSQRVTAEELVGMLNGIFSQFDQIARKHGLEKIKTIGDAYMAVAGAPTFQENHAERAALFALEVTELMKDYHTNSGEKIDIRIGLHSGSVVAGIIGENKFAYDLWGDAVNTASRMESHGEPGKIHCTEEFIRALSLSSLSFLPSLQFVERGEMEIKGKGKMKTYFLEQSK